jgi:hypothetical protein
MNDFLVEVDVLRGQAECLSLSKSEAGTDLDEDATALRQGCAYGRHPVGRPRLDPADPARCGCGRADGTRATWVALETPDFDGCL